MQFQTLCGTDSRFETLDNEKSYFLQGHCRTTGIPIYWYRDIQDIPREFSLFIANEFLDALPIHKLQVFVSVM